ncbi:hypothetical protein RRG08_044417 [Elysia crispata]|uniref:Uncharacterized protein n=1 Tax=Elysia crispata TaxID=231223 RepID=A0AAE0ZUR1_9GAST|nr:hypothetical protein RRG08_044417 [Elysia crispata]
MNLIALTEEGHDIVLHLKMGGVMIGRASVILCSQHPSFISRDKFPPRGNLACLIQFVPGQVLSPRAGCECLASCTSRASRTDLSRTKSGTRGKTVRPAVYPMGQVSLRTWYSSLGQRSVLTPTDLGMADTSTSQFTLGLTHIERDVFKQHTSF